MQASSQKQCNLCKQVKNKEDFYEGKTCLLCYPTYQKNRRLKNPEKFKEYEKTKYIRHGYKIKKRAKQWYHDNMEKAKSRIMKDYYNNRKEILMARQLKKYNLTQAEFDVMLEKCHSKCQICERQFFTIEGEEIIAHKICIDHCHKTGKIRGLLCNNCNSAIGFFNEDPQLIKNAIEFLDKYGPPERTPEELVEFAKY